MRLNIYHTNDIHSNFSFLSRVCGYLEQYRQEEDLYLDSGDFLDLKSILVQADRGAGALKLLKLCGLEAMALGNNELDFGCPDLEKLMAYPLLCANLTRADGTPVRGLQSHRIVERLGKRFLIIGLAPYFGEGMVPSRYNLFFEMGDLHTVDPVPAVTKILEENRGSYDFSILLSHSGHPVDRELEKRLPPVDLWLEGHSHAVITEERYSQSGMGQLLGRVTLEVGEKDIRILESAQIELPEQGSSRFCAQWEKTRASAEEILSRELPVVGELEFDPFRESELTNFICDCLKAEFGGDLALMHSGISQGPLRRPVSRRSLLENFPSKLNPAIYALSGRQLLETVRCSLDDEHIRQSGRGPGFRGTVLGCLGFSSNVKLRREPLALELDGSPLEPDRVYTIVTDDYLQRGTGYPTLAVPDAMARFDKRFIRDLVEEYLMNQEAFRTASIRREEEERWGDGASERQTGRSLGDGYFVPFK